MISYLGFLLKKAVPNKEKKVLKLQKKNIAVTINPSYPNSVQREKINLIFFSHFFVVPQKAL